MIQITDDLRFLLAGVWKMEDCILVLLNYYYGETFNAWQIKAVLETARFDHRLNAATLSATLCRLKKADKLVRVSPGKYQAKVVVQ